VPVSRGGVAWQKVKAFYDRNLGLFFVFLAQMFASIVSTPPVSAHILENTKGLGLTAVQMSMTTRLLETGFETKFHALQIIFVRMILTAVVGSLYMWYKQVPDFPFGQRGVRGLLILRGFAGTVGLFGLYCKYSRCLLFVPFLFFFVPFSRWLISDTRGNQTRCRIWTSLTLLSSRFSCPRLQHSFAGSL
jgi:hypothetical protein